MWCPGPAAPAESFAPRAPDRPPRRSRCCSAGARCSQGGWSCTTPWPWPSPYAIGGSNPKPGRRRGRIPRPRLPGRGLLALRLLRVAEDRELVARALAGLLVGLLALPRVRLSALGHVCFSRRRLSLLMVSWRRTMRPGRRPVRRIGAGLAILRFATSASPAHTTTGSSGVVVVWPCNLIAELQPIQRVDFSHPCAA